MSDEHETPDASVAEHAASIDRECARFEGEYVESADLMGGAPVTLVVKDVIPPNTEKSADGRLVDKPIIVFEGARKRFVMGKTNERIVKAMHGRKPSQWIGKSVTLGVRYLKSAFGENNVPTVRVIPPAGVAIPFAARKHYGSDKPWT